MFGNQTGSSSSSSAYYSPLMDVGLPQDTPQDPISRYSHPITVSYPLQVIGPSGRSNRVLKFKLDMVPQVVFHQRLRLRAITRSAAILAPAAFVVTSEMAPGTPAHKGNEMRVTRVGYN